MHLSNEKDDAYYRALPRIVRDLQKKNQYALTGGEAILLALFTIIPIGGCIYFICKRKNPNLNIQVYAKKAILVNLIHTVCLVLMIAGVAFFVPKFGDSKVQQPTSEVEVPKEEASTEVDIEEDTEENTSSSAEQTTEDASESKENTSSIKYENEVLSVSVNGHTEAFPYSDEKAVADGFTLSDQTQNPVNHDEVIAYYFDAVGSMLTLTFDTNSQCNEMSLEFVDPKTECLGLNMQSTVEQVNSVCKEAENIDTASFVEDLGNGDISYTYGKYVITVSFNNSYVKTISISEKEIES